MGLGLNQLTFSTSEGQLRINEIAAQCGYANAYYFTNAFRAECGVSPTEFRRRYLTNTP